MFLKLCLAGLLSAPCLSAQDFSTFKEGPAPDHLVPASADEFEEIVFLAPTGFNMVMYFRGPSFGAPAALTITGSESDGSGWSLDTPGKDDAVFHATVMELNRRFRVVSDEDLVRRQHSLKIDRSLAVALHQVWRGFVLQTTHPKTRHSGLDGTTYFFSAYAGGIDPPGFISGQAWAPPKNTMPGELVDFADRFILLVKSGKSPTEEEREKLLQELAQLQEKLKARQDKATGR